MKPIVLVAYAVEQEHVLLDNPLFSFEYCRTGVGKVNAALSVVDAVQKYRPQLVVNLATAGSVLHDVGSVHVCAKFVDRDMEKLSAFGVPCMVDYENDPVLLRYLGGIVPKAVCNTGDTFMTSGDGTGDVFDMEAFAIARACHLMDVPFVSIKFVTDIIGQNSVKHWADKLEDARRGLSEYMHHVFLPNINIAEE